LGTSSLCATKTLDQPAGDRRTSGTDVCDEYGEDKMHIRSLFVLGGTVLLIAANAFAGPKEDVAAATAKWGETLGQDDPDKVLALYATDAVLWGTEDPSGSI
jgi:hypothetical protein